MKSLLLILLIFANSSWSHTVIVNKKNSLNSITVAQLKEIYLGDKLRWDDNTQIHVVDYSSTAAERKEFTENLLGLTITRVYKSWIKISLAGASTPPKILRSQTEVIEAVSSDFSAIGYLENISSTNLNNVKILKLEN